MLFRSRRRGRQRKAPADFLHHLGGPSHVEMQGRDTDRLRAFYVSDLVVDEKRPFGRYGLPMRQAFGKLFWFGTLWGFGSITILLVALHVAHAFDFGGLALHGIRAVKFAVFWGTFFLIVGFYEEFFTRGYTQFALTHSVGFWPAAILLSVGFGALHLENPGESWVGILGAVLIGRASCRERV